jgi:hypothetical protein
MEDGTVMKNFALQHVDAEDILVVARPHLGLATGEMIGIDVSLSADLQIEPKVPFNEWIGVDFPARTNFQQFDSLLVHFFVPLPKYRTRCG